MVIVLYKIIFPRSYIDLYYGKTTGYSSMSEKIVIPKDACLCDVCNVNLTDEKFVAIANSFWYEGWLYCENCRDKYKPDMKLIMKIIKGDDLSNTDLAKPIIMEMF